MLNRYQVLARRYRPQTFTDVVGQSSAVTTLKNAIRFEKIAHAYLFCGSRGVGKTTLARLFAKTLNCEKRLDTIEPCGKCPSCLEIVSGQSLDVIEIDGASNRGIDDIRQINETIGYSPSHGRYKIYIIDEVHMLTKEAFNALLKTLEEPPERAKFFFATTEPHKVLPTIISRCQRFDLGRIQPDLIVDKLSQIAQDLSREVEKEALLMIASFAEGSLRDAESLFDQILCFSDEMITVDIVRENLGLVPKELFDSLDKAFSSCHLPFAFEMVESLFQTGKDLSHFFEELINHYRTILVAKCKQQPLPSAKYYTEPQALFILDLLIKAEKSFKQSVFQRVSLESILLQVIRSKNRVPIETIVRHLTNSQESLKPLLPESTPPALEKKAPAEPEAQLHKSAPTPLDKAPTPKVEEPISTPPSLEKMEPPEPKAQVSESAPTPLDKAPAPKVEEPIAPISTPPSLEKMEPAELKAQVSESAPTPLEKTAPFKQENLLEPVEPEKSTPPLATEKQGPLVPSKHLPPHENKPPSSSKISLKEVPFHPSEHLAALQSDPKSEKSQEPAQHQKHPSHYETLLRFTAVELEGSVKK